MNKSLKYILIGLVSAMCCKYIPDNMINNKSILMISFSISIFYALLDRAIPSINYIENKVDDN